MHPINLKSLLLLSIALTLLAGCALTRPQVHDSLSAQDSADVQVKIREATKAPLLSIEASGAEVFAYTGERAGGVVYVFKRNQAGRLEECGCGEWDGRP